MTTPHARRLGCISLRFVTGILASFVAWPTAYAQDSDNEPIRRVGYVEKITLEKTGVSLSAKIDTGAKTSSINAPRYEIYKRNGKKWVRFKLETRKGKTVTIKSKLRRMVRIRRAGVELRRRPVIKIKTCLGGKTINEEFTLADRTAMNYQVIVGRSFLSGRFVVDPEETFLTSGKCVD